MAIQATDIASLDSFTIAEQIKALTQAKMQVALGGQAYTGKVGGFSLTRASLAEIDRAIDKLQTLQAESDSPTGMLTALTAFEHHQ